MRAFAAAALADQSAMPPPRPESTGGTAHAVQGEATATPTPLDAFLFGQDSGRDAVWEGIASTDRIALLGLGCGVLAPFDAAAAAGTGFEPVPDFAWALDAFIMPDARLPDTDTLFA